MAVTDWKSPSATGAIDNEWGNPERMYASDNSRAQAGDAAKQDYTGFDFDDDVPEGATITGWEWGIGGRVTTSGDLCQIQGIMVIGGVKGGRFATLTTYTLTRDTTYSSGGDGTLQDNAPTAAEVRASNFGIHLTHYALDALQLSVFLGDHLQIRIYYTELTSLSISEVVALSDTRTIAVGAEYTDVAALSDIIGVSVWVALENSIALLDEAARGTLIELLEPLAWTDGAEETFLATLLDLFSLISTATGEKTGMPVIDQPGTEKRILRTSCRKKQIVKVSCVEKDIEP